jgi:hypothetical protein
MMSGVAGTLQGTIKAVQRYGVLAGAAYVFDRARVGRAERIERFDERHGTTTEGKVYAWQLPHSDEGSASGEFFPYEAAPASLIREAIDSLPITPSHFTFVDLGSGMGRALLVASQVSFRRLVGVEVSCEFDRIARSNIHHYCNGRTGLSRFDLQCMDARQYDFGRDPLVVYLFNPFGKDTFDVVMSRLERSLSEQPRPVFVIYVNPQFEQRLRRSLVFKKIGRRGSRWRPWRHYVVYSSRWQ